MASRAVPPLTRPARTREGGLPDRRQRGGSRGPEAERSARQPRGAVARWPRGSASTTAGRAAHTPRPPRPGVLDHGDAYPSAKAGPPKAPPPSAPGWLCSAAVVSLGVAGKAGRSPSVCQGPVPHGDGDPSGLACRSRVAEAHGVPRLPTAPLTRPAHAQLARGRRPLCFWPRGRGRISQ